MLKLKTKFEARHALLLRYYQLDISWNSVASSIPARYHTFVEIEHEIISTVILLPSADLFKKGCCQLQAKVCAQITGLPLAQACPGKSVVK